MPRLTTSLIAVSVLLLATLVQPFLQPQNVDAVTASDWQAGNIIDDALFTNASAMTVSQIQAWLDTRLANCDYYGTKPSELSGGIDYDKNGVVTRAEYGRTMGNPAPFTCLNDYYEVPKTAPSSTVPVNNYGTSTIPAGAKSAAQLIYDAAQAYNISPKVLLVKLGTESAGPLTSDSWPFERQYLYAMGAHCPDSGPGGSANCDTDYAGFSLQIREAAKLLRWYLDSMTESWWPYKKPYATNYILWNVKPTGCGGSNVYIKSKATAALYTYTPYQPNSASLSSYPGTGNSCSSYGNRNFWYVYNNWFGSTLITIRGSIKAYYDSIDGAVTLGSPLYNERSDGTGVNWQCFTRGCIIGSYKTGYWESKGSIRSLWTTMGYEHGSLGLPIGPEIAVPGGGWRQSYKGGTIVGSGTTGYRVVRGSIETYYLNNNGPSTLGVPLGYESFKGGVWHQQFNGGYVMGSSKTGYWTVSGAIGERYIDNDDFSMLGAPTSNEKYTATAWAQEFQYGYIVGLSSTGYYEVRGSIGSAYASNLEDSLIEYGRPVGTEAGDGAGVNWQEFQNALFIGSSGKYYPVQGPIRARWLELGGYTGKLGLPVASTQYKQSGGSWQKFTNGYLLLQNGSVEAWESLGSIRKKYSEYGHESGYLGYPLGPETYDSKEKKWAQQYENGTIVSIGGVPTVEWPQ